MMRKSGLPEIPEEMAQAHKARLEKLDKTKDSHQILGIAIGLEEEARDFYKSQVEKVKDPVATEVYSFLAKFEQGHVNILTAWKNKL
jgi:rubrerythrin